MYKRKQSRRTALKLMGSASFVGLAGCTGNGNGSGPEFIRHLGWGGSVQDVVAEIGEEWTEESGIEVRTQSAAGNVEFISYLQQNPGEIDLWSSNDFALALAEQETDGGLVVRPLDTSQIPNYQEIFSEEWRNLDFMSDKPGLMMRLVVLGYGYNSNELDGSFSTWEDLRQESLTGELTLHDVAEDRFIQAGAVMGNSIEELLSDDELFDEAVGVIEDYHEQVFTYYSDLAEGNRLLREGTALAAEAFSGRIVSLQEDGNEHIEFVIPEEGAKTVVDTLSIPADSEKIEATYDFLNFLYRRENQLKLAERQGYPIPIEDPPDRIVNLPGYASSPDELLLVDHESVINNLDEMQAEFDQIKQS